MIKRKHIILLLSVFVFISLNTIGYSQDSSSSAPPSSGTSQSYDFTKEGYGEVFIENYPLGPGDQLIIRVFTLDPFEEDIKISQFGKLILPTIGELDVAGWTIPKLQEKLTELYMEYYTDFTLSVELVSVKKIQIYVFGNVSNPGIYTVFANTTLLEFLQKIGLSTSGANRRLIHHRQDETTEIDPFRLSVFGEIEEQNMYLQFGDRIEIPLAEVSVFLTGKVYRPGVYEVLPNETLKDILKLAGGPDPFADIVDAVIERPRQDGTFERIRVDLDKIWNDQDLFKLKHRDRLYVPPKDFDVYLLGAVGSPGRYPFVEGKSVEQYVSDAGGFLSDAHLGFVTVIRPGPRYGNQVSEKYLVNLKNVLTEKIDDRDEDSAFNTPRVIIEPGDVIMVPYKGTDVMHRNLGTMLNVLQNIFQSFLIFKN